LWNKWQPHRTKERLEFRRFERQVNEHYEFRHLGWFIRVPKSSVSWYSESRE
jgi:hypothetical protein